ncbi:MAG: glycosyltransferase family 39 protein [Terracidiphilus sp.]
MPQSLPLIPARTPLRATLLLAGIFATLTFLIHFASSLWGSHLGYGFFRDELYFLVCGRHPAWGYVDQPPLVALQARLAETLFGLSPTGIRIFSFAAGGVTVALTGLIAWQLGGRRVAQVLAMTAVLAAPVFLGTANYLSMNSFEPCFWMGSLLVVLRLTDGSAGPRAWLLFGLLAGLGIENKHSTVFFLVALLAGLILSPQRRILWSRWCAAGVGLLILIALPNLLWQWVHHFPTYVLLNNVAHSDKNTKFPPLAFLREQANMLLIVAAPIWIGGLAWLAFARNACSRRFVALTYLLFLAMMMVMHAKDYYVAPIYPVLFAAGAVAFAQLTRRNWPPIVYTVLIAYLLCRATAPIMLTILPPDKYTAYTARFGANKVKSEKFTSPLPQYLSDRFGWPEMVAGFAARYDALPPDVRAHTTIFCGNYGEASAVNILGAPYGLPTAISGHQNYFYWGYGNDTGEYVLTLRNPADTTDDYFATLTDLGAFDAPWIMDHEHLHYFLLSHPRQSPLLPAIWPELRYWY